jgi:SAM-dependent methyltransferase
MTGITVDRAALEAKVKHMYTAVAEHPDGEFHFEMGRAMAERLGYAPADLDRVPHEAIDSFAGVGHYFHLAALNPGERVVDLGSGSGMDAFVAGLRVGATGQVVGIDMTDAQLAKMTRLAAAGSFSNVSCRKGYIEDTGLAAGEFDCVISNGVINLAPEKELVFAEAARVLKPGGRLAIADIVSEQQMKESIVCDADLWASCIGGAAQVDAYREAIEGSGLGIEQIRENPYQFISDRARDASAKYGVKSVSLLAIKPQ